MLLPSSEHDATAIRGVPLVGGSTSHCPPDQSQVLRLPSRVREGSDAPRGCYPSLQLVLLGPGKGELQGNHPAAGGLGP